MRNHPRFPDLTDDELNAHAHAIEAAANDPANTAATLSIPIEGQPGTAAPDAPSLFLNLRVRARVSRPVNLRDPSSGAALTWAFEAAFSPQSSDDTENPGPYTGSATVSPSLRDGRSAELPWTHPDYSFRMRGRLLIRSHILQPARPALLLSETPQDESTSPHSACKRFATLRCTQLPLTADRSDLADLCLWSPDPFRPAETARSAGSRALPASLRLSVLRPDEATPYTIEGIEGISRFLHAATRNKRPFRPFAEGRVMLHELLAAHAIHYSTHDRNLNGEHLRNLATVMATPATPFQRPGLAHAHFDSPNSRLLKELNQASRAILRDCVLTADTALGTHALLDAMRAESDDEQQARQQTATLVAARMRDRATLGDSPPRDLDAPVNRATRDALNRFQRSANALQMRDRSLPLQAYRPDVRTRTDDAGMNEHVIPASDHRDTRLLETDACSANPMAGTLHGHAALCLLQDGSPGIFLRVAAEPLDESLSFPEPDDAEPTPDRRPAMEPPPLHVLGDRRNLQPVRLASLEAGGANDRIAIHVNGQWLFRNQPRTPDEMRRLATEAARDNRPLRAASLSSDADLLHPFHAAIPAFPYQDPSRSILAVNLMASAVRLPDSPGPATEHIRADGTAIVDPQLLTRAHAAFIPYANHGATTFEDSIVISESFAKTLTAEDRSHAYSRNRDIRWTNRTQDADPERLQRLTQGDLDQIARLDPAGKPHLPPGHPPIPVRRGDIIRFGLDPHSGATNRNPRAKPVPVVVRAPVSGHITGIETETWEDSGAAYNGWTRTGGAPAEPASRTDPETDSPLDSASAAETDASHDPLDADPRFAQVSPGPGDTRLRFTITTRLPVEPGDKIATQSGCKAVISAILPDARMPYDSQADRHADLCLNPLSVPSRLTFAPYLEAATHACATRSLRELQDSLRDGPPQDPQEWRRAEALLDLFTAPGNAEALRLAAQVRAWHDAGAPDAENGPPMPDSHREVLLRLAAAAPHPGQPFRTPSDVREFLDLAEPSLPRSLRQGGPGEASPFEQSLVRASRLPPQDEDDIIRNHILALDPDTATLRKTPQTDLEGPERTRFHELIGFDPRAADRHARSILLEGAPLETPATFGIINMLRSEHHAARGITSRGLEGPYSETGQAAPNPGRTPQRVGASELMILTSVDPSGSIVAHLAELSHRRGTTELARALRNGQQPDAADTGRDAARLPADQILFGLGLSRSPSGRIAPLPTRDTEPATHVTHPDGLTDPHIFGTDQQWLCPCGHDNAALADRHIADTGQPHTSCGKPDCNLPPLSRDDQARLHGYIPLPHPIPNPLFLDTPARRYTALLPALLCTSARKIRDCAAASDYRKNAEAIASAVPDVLTQPAMELSEAIPPGPGAGARWLCAVLALYDPVQLPAIAASYREHADAATLTHDVQPRLAAAEILDTVAASHDTDAPIHLPNAMLHAIPVPSRAIRREHREPGTTEPFAAPLDPLYRRVLNALSMRSAPATHAATAPDAPLSDHLQRRVMAAVRRLYVKPPEKGRPQPPLLHLLAGKRAALALNETGFRCTNSARAVITCNPEILLGNFNIPWKMASVLYQAPAIARLRAKSLPVPDRRRNRNRPAAEKPRLTHADALAAIREATPDAIDAVTREMDCSPMLVGRQPTIHAHNIQCFRPGLCRKRDGTVDLDANRIELPQLVCGGFGADFDGDKMWVIPMLREQAANAALRQFAPTAALRKDGDRSPLYVPTHEAAWGLLQCLQSEPGSIPRSLRTILAGTLRQHGVPANRRATATSVLEEALAETPANKKGIARVIDTAITAHETGTISADACLAIHDALNRTGLHQLRSQCPPLTFGAYLSLRDTVRPLCDRLLDGTAIGTFAPGRDCRDERVPDDAPGALRIAHTRASGAATKACSDLVAALATGGPDAAAAHARSVLANAPARPTGPGAETELEHFQTGFREHARQLLAENPEALPILRDINAGTRLKPAQVINLVHGLGAPLNAVQQGAGTYISRAIIDGLHPLDMAANRASAKAAITGHQTGTALGTDLSLRLANACSALRWQNKPCDSPGTEIPLYPDPEHRPRLLGLVAAAAMPAAQIAENDVIGAPALQRLADASARGDIPAAIPVHAPGSCTAGPDTVCSRCSPIARKLPDGARPGGLSSLSVMEPIIQAALQNKHTGGRCSSPDHLRDPAPSRIVQKLISDPDGLASAWPEYAESAREAGEPIGAAVRIASDLAQAAPDSTDPVLIQLLAHSLDREAARTRHCDLYAAAARNTPGASAARTSNPTNAVSALLHGFDARHTTETDILSARSARVSKPAAPDTPSPARARRQAQTMKRHLPRGRAA